MAIRCFVKLEKKGKNRIKYHQLLQSEKVNV